jgi:hypothetical protein
MKPKAYKQQKGYEMSSLTVCLLKNEPATCI